MPAAREPDGRELLVRMHHCKRVVGKPTSLEHGYDRAEADGSRQ